MRAPTAFILIFASACATTHALDDVEPFTESGLLRAYVEIPRGESKKWEYDARTNALRLDRTLDESLGGYPTNYGFVPQTLGYDGDPFDVLVLGPPLPKGAFVLGVVVGVMHMTDEKGRDDKVVIARVGDDGQPLHGLDEAEQQRIGAWFVGYKKLDEGAGKWAKVSGWSGPKEAAAIVAEVRQAYRSAR